MAGLSNCQAQRWCQVKILKSGWRSDSQKVRNRQEVHRAWQYHGQGSGQEVRNPQCRSKEAEVRNPPGTGKAQGQTESATEISRTSTVCILCMHRLLRLQLLIGSPMKSAVPVLAIFRLVLLSWGDCSFSSLKSGRQSAEQSARTAGLRYWVKSPGHQQPLHAKRYRDFYIEARTESIMIVLETEEQLLKKAKHNFICYQI